MCINVSTYTCGCLLMEFVCTGVAWTYRECAGMAMGPPGSTSVSM